MSNITITEILLPDNTTITLHTIFNRQQTNQSLVVLIEIVNKLIFPQSTDVLQAQAKRSVVRQAMISMNMWSRNAHPQELKLLKHSKILPTTAPTASWITIYSTILLMKRYCIDSSIINAVCTAFYINSNDIQLNLTQVPNVYKPKPKRKHIRTLLHATRKSPRVNKYDRMHLHDNDDISDTEQHHTTNEHNYSSNVSTVQCTPIESSITGGGSAQYDISPDNIHPDEAQQSSNTPNLQPVKAYGLTSTALSPQLNTPILHESTILSPLTNNKTLTHNNNAIQPPTPGSYFHTISPANFNSARSSAFNSPNWTGMIPTPLASPSNYHNNNLHNVNLYTPFTSTSRTLHPLSPETHSITTMSDLFNSPIQSTPYRNLRVNTDTDTQTSIAVDHLLSLTPPNGTRTLAQPVLSTLIDNTIPSIPVTSHQTDTVQTHATI